MSWSPRTAASLALLRAAERLHRAAAALAADRPIPDAPRPLQGDSRALAERASRARHPSTYGRDPSTWLDRLPADPKAAAEEFWHRADAGLIPGPPRLRAVPPTDRSTGTP